MNAASVAAFAKPLQRKERKDMELRSWKDMPSGEDPRHERQESRKAHKLIQMIPLSGDSPTTPMDVDNNSNNTSVAEFDMASDDQMIEIVSEQATLGSQERNASTSSRSNVLGTRHASSSLESEIDVENHARLQTMSPQEIAEAQAELLDKMDPALLSILKKRGQDKLKKRKHSVPGVSNTNQETNNSRTDGHFFIHSRQGQAVTPSASEAIAIPKETSVVQNSALAQGFLWDTWTERVEATRELRFSFDGNVVTFEDDDFPPAETGQ